MSQITYYVLDENHNLIPTNNILTWGRFFENIDKRRVAVKKLGPIHVSTVFLGIDHGFEPSSPPIVFETMVFDSFKHGDYCRRYCTWAEAEAGHRETVKMVFGTRGVVVDLPLSLLLYLWRKIPRLPVYEGWSDTLKWLFYINRG